jgi:prepilin-type N-terminal cleavage/methylation domain-containing protein
MEIRTQTGFTLYELLVTLLIVGVVLTLGIPNLSDFTRNSRITSTANDLHASFLMARSEAARAKTNITICASSNSMDADATCQGTWDQGFIVFLDDDADLDSSDAGDSILRAHPAAAEGITLAIDFDATYFMFAATGLGRQDAGFNTAISRVIICDQRGVVETSKDFSAGRLFVATPLGRATVIRDFTMVDSASTALTTLGDTCP